MAAAETSGVSPYHLASRVLLEVGWGGSISTSGTYVGALGDLRGYYNFFNGCIRCE